MTKIFTNQIPGDGRVAVLLYGLIGEGMKADSARVVAELMELAAQYSKIDLHINSQGGDVFAGIAIYNALRTVQADVDIYIDGLAASIAGVIALCGRPLYMNKYARIMLHRVSGGSWGTAEDLRTAADAAEQMEASLAEMIANRCKMTAEAVKESYFDGKEHWINAQQALDMGLIDGIIEEAPYTLPADATNEEIYQFTNRLLTEPQNQENMALIEDLKKRPSFANMSTEDQMLQHITTLENQAAKVPAMEARIIDLTNQLNEQKKASRTAYLNQAVSEGRITAEQVPTFLNLMEADEVSARAAIDSMPKRGSTKIEDVLHMGGTGNTDLANMSWDQIDKAERLAELKATNPELYQQKFNEKFGK
jgi:ATP-dependent Clp endopeptidase proteolytic subunit ClpP